MKVLSIAGALVALVLSLAAPAVAATVTVRVEGLEQTLVPKTPVTTTSTPIAPDGDPEHACAGTSALAALDTATGGDWSGVHYDGFGWSVEEIKGESHPFDFGAPINYYWTFWNNYEYQNAGACDTELQEGDEVVWTLGCFGEACPVSPTPLRLRLPATAGPGQAVIADVEQYTLTCDENGACETAPEPAAGATVTIDGQARVADEHGRVSFVPGDRGPHAVRASKEGYVRSATETVCVTDGADGACGTTIAPPECETNGADGRCGTRDRTAPRASVLGITDGQRFGRKQGPRELTGVVAPDVSGIKDVKIALTRKRGSRCWYLSRRADRLKRKKCTPTVFIRIGDRENWSYLLPKRLPRGHYRLAVTAIDRSFNRDPLERGRTDVRFRVG